MIPPLFSRFSKKARRIGVLTAGGDCPGLNAVIRAVVKTAVLTYGWEVVGIKDGFDGLIGDEASTVALTTDSVQGILALGGTILGAASRTNPFLYTRRQQGNRILLDVTPVSWSGFKSSNWMRSWSSAVMAPCASHASYTTWARRWLVCPKLSTTTLTAQMSRSVSIPPWALQPRRSTGCVRPRKAIIVR